MAGPWTVGSADFTLETAPPDAVVRTELLPAPFTGNGLLLEGTNRSDDLLLYASQAIAGLPASTDFLAAIDVEIVTDTPTGCAGVGGSPGESVWIVSMASATEPAVVDFQGMRRLNLERGNQSQPGNSSDVPGTIASSNTDCATRKAPESKWLLPTRSIPVRSDVDGRVWITLGMDSGFEAKSRVWIRSATVRLRPAR
ncbi:MAG: hypothetical protein ACKO5K_01010 [Armatimonadota bacterium]